jgi:hypothetical protein
MLELTPFTNEDISKSAQSLYIQNGTIPKAVEIAEKLYTATSGDFTPSEFTLGGGVIGAMYWVYIYASDCQLRARALKILRRTKTREGPWDATVILRSIDDKLLVAMETGPIVSEHIVPLQRNWCKTSV